MTATHKQPGAFVVSLDFELYWGVRDKCRLDAYRDNLLGSRQIIKSLLELFCQHEIHATWAIVGFLFAANRDELLAAVPPRQPNYRQENLSPYPVLQQIGANEAEDPFHFAASLIRHIAGTPHQEIASHTFSHYYCREEGHDYVSFRDDLVAAINIAQRYGHQITSLVFPRNQCNDDYLAICRELGITSYRGTQPGWMYAAKSELDETLFRRAMRLLDAYTNLTGHQCYRPAVAVEHAPCNVRASRFLRPYSARLRFLEPLRLRRIMSDLSHAARHGLVYHLWWHPHNFGVNRAENLAALAQILDHVDLLRRQYDFRSMHMRELAAHYLAPTQAQTKTATT